MSATKIQFTRNYRLFEQHDSENRLIDVAKHKRLMESMQRYGFLACFPVVVRKVGARLIVRDGQHRLVIAETLDTGVYFVEQEVNFDIGMINQTAKVWRIRDYAEMHAANDRRDYAEGLEFAADHGLPLGTAFALLAGTTSFRNCEEAFIGGSFKAKDRDWADAVAGLYVPLVALAPRMKNARLVEACMAVCRVKGFDRSRLLLNAERCREKLVSYSTRDGCLEMMEQVYNYGRKQILPLKCDAIMAMRERNAAVSRKKNKKNPAA